MLFDCTKKVFAYIGAKPRPGRPLRVEVANEHPPYGFSWRDEQNVIGRTMGAAKSDVHTYKPGVYRSASGALYDTRVMPPDAVATLQDFEDRKNALIKAQAEWLAEHFRTWPIATRDDFEQPQPTNQTKAEARAKIRAEAPRSHADVEAERRSLNAINRAFNRVLR